MPRPKRFKVQRRVDLHARDRSNKRFLFAVIWRTVNEADKQITAESLLLKQKRDRPRSEFRLAEEWPIGAEPRPIFRMKARRIAVPVTRP